MCRKLYYLRYIYDGFMGQKILKLWRQESWSLGLGWVAHIMSIRLWTFRLPCFGVISTIFYNIFLNGYKCEKSSLLSFKRTGVFCLSSCQFCKKTNKKFKLFAKLTSCTLGFCSYFCVHFLGRLTLLKIQANNFVPVPNAFWKLQSWGCFNAGLESNLSKYVSNCYQYVKIQVQTFPIYSSYHSFVDVVTFSANQKSVKPSEIAIFQVQMQSKNWWNNQIRSKKRFWPLILCHPIPFLRVSCLKSGPNWPNRQYCLAGSSKTAPRILIFSIVMNVKPSF